MNYILMRIYDGGGLATWEKWEGDEVDLNNKLVEFTAKKAGMNLGTKTAVLTSDEVVDMVNSLGVKDHQHILIEYDANKLWTPIEYDANTL